MKVNFIITLFFVLPTISIAQYEYNVPGINLNKAADAFSKSFNQARNSKSNSISTSLSNSNNYENITIDLLKFMPGFYRTIVISKVSGWDAMENFKSIAKEIRISNVYQLVNAINKNGSKERIGRNRHVFLPQIPEKYWHDTSTIFLELNRDALSDFDRVTRLVLKNSSDNVIYQAEYKNKSFIEILRPVVSEYRITKAEAANEVLKLKEYLKSGLISQIEYDRKLDLYRKVLIEEK